MATAPKTFFEKLLPYAKAVERETGIPSSVVLTQWANESGFESDTWIGGNNYAGITINGNPALGFRKYDTVEAFTKDYIATIKLPYYDAVREAGKDGRRVDAIFELLGRSPWDGDHYTDPEKGTPGSSLTNLYFREKVWTYTVNDPDKPKSFWDQFASNMAMAGGGGAGQTTMPGVTPEVAQAMVGEDSFWKSADWWKRTGQMIGFIVGGILLIGFALWFLGKGSVVSIASNVLKGGE